MYEMFSKKLEDTRPDVLDRIRRQRSLSRGVSLIPETVAPPFVTHRSTNTQENASEDNLLHALGGIFQIPSSSLSEREVLNRCRSLHDSSSLLSKALKNIASYEGRLRDLVGTGANASYSGETLGLDELVRRAFGIAQEADKQYRYQSQQIAQLRIALERRVEEVHNLRARNSQLEDAVLKFKIDHLKATCGSVLVKSNDQQSAVDELLRTVQESETRRVLLEQELTKLKSHTPRVISDSLCQDSPNLFVEVTELRELVRELTMKLYVTAPLTPRRVFTEPTSPAALRTESVGEPETIHQSFAAELEHDSQNPPCA